jgi:hypothetical protein
VVRRAGEVQEAGERSADRSAPVHDPEQDQRQAERAHHLDERVAAGESGADHHPVQEVDHAAREHADRESEPVRAARVHDQVVGDQGSGRADCAECEVEHPGRPVEHDQADPRERVHAPEGQPGHDEGLQELPVHPEDAESEEAGHRSFLFALIVIPSFVDVTSC